MFEVGFLKNVVLYIGLSIGFVIHLLMYIAYIGGFYEDAKKGELGTALVEGVLSVYLFIDTLLWLDALRH